jgi:hypothetical protein
MLRDIKESTLNVILQEFKKVEIIPQTNSNNLLNNINNNPKRQLKGQAFLNLNEEEKNSTKNPNQILDSIIPRVDISKKLQNLIKEFDANLQAKSKIEILGKVEQLIEEANNRILPNGLNDLFDRLRNNLNDGNKTFVRKILKIYLKIIEALGSQSKNFSKFIVKNVLNNLSDSQVHVREDAKNVLQKYIELNGLDSLVKNCNGFLMENKYDLRFEILNLLIFNIGKFKESNTEEFVLLVEGIVNCLLDKNMKIKELAEKICSEIMKYVRINCFEKILIKFKPEISNCVRPVIEKYVGNFTGNLMKCNGNLNLNKNSNEENSKNESFDKNNNNNNINDLNLKLNEDDEFDKNNKGKKANLFFDDNFKLNFNKEIKIDLPKFSNNNNNYNKDKDKEKEKDNHIPSNIFTNFENLKFDNNNYNKVNSNININNNQNYNILTKSDIKNIDQIPIKQKIFKSDYSLIIFERKKRIEQDKKILEEGKVKEKEKEKENFPKNFLEDFYILKAQEELKSILSNETLIPYMISNDQIKFEVFLQKIISSFEEEKLQIFINLDLLLKILLSKIHCKKNLANSDLYLRLSAEFLNSYYINKSDCHLSEIEKKLIKEIIFTIFTVKNFNFVLNFSYTNSLSSTSSSSFGENEKGKNLEMNLKGLIFEEFLSNENTSDEIIGIDYDAVLFFSGFLMRNFYYNFDFNSKNDFNNFNNSVNKNLYFNKDKLFKIFVDYLTLRFNINNNNINNIFDVEKFKLFGSVGLNDNELDINELKGLFVLIKEIINCSNNKNDNDNNDKLNILALKNLLNLLHFRLNENNKIKLEDYMYKNFEEIFYLLNSTITNKLSNKQIINNNNYLSTLDPTKSHKANSIKKSIDFFTQKLKELRNTKNTKENLRENLKEKLDNLISFEELVINKINIFDIDYSNIIINDIDKIFDSFFSIYFDLLNPKIQILKEEIYSQEKNKIFVALNNLFSKILLIENFPKNLKNFTIKNLFENLCEIIIKSNSSNFTNEDFIINENLKKFILPFFEKILTFNDYDFSLKILLEIFVKNFNENFLYEKISGILKEKFVTKLNEEIQFIKIEEIIFNVFNFVEIMKKNYNNIDNKNIEILFEENNFFKFICEIIYELVKLIKEQIWVFYKKALKNFNNNDNNYNEFRIKNIIKSYLRIENGINSEKNIEYINNNQKEIQEILKSIGKKGNVSYNNSKEDLKENLNNLNNSNLNTNANININININKNDGNSSLFNSNSTSKNNSNSNGNNNSININKSELFILTELKKLIKQFSQSDNFNNNDNISKNLIKKKYALEILAFLKKEKIKFEMLKEYLPENDIIFIKDISHEIRNSNQSEISISKKSINNTEIIKKDNLYGFNSTSDFGNLISKVKLNLF